MTKPVIGFIGLGLMGGNMVENLQNRGYELIVMDLNKEAVARVIARGNAAGASSAKELAAASDIVMLCLTTSEVVEKIVYAEDGILAGIREGAVLIDFGTSIPASTRKIGADLAAKGAGMIDAPLGRTPAHAKDGLLNIMASGDRATFDKVKPVLDEQGEIVREQLGTQIRITHRDLALESAERVHPARIAGVDLGAVTTRTLLFVIAGGVELGGARDAGRQRDRHGRNVQAEPVSDHRALSRRAVPHPRISPLAGASQP